MNNWLYSPTKLVGISQMRSDGQWESHILSEPIKIKEGNSMELYQGSELTCYGKRINAVDDDAISGYIWHWIGCVDLVRKEELSPFSAIIAKWIIRLK